MDATSVNRLTMEKCKNKFYGNDKLYSKYLPKVPVSAEREYARVMSAYMKMLKDVLESELPNIKSIYKRERDTAIADNRRTDGLEDITKAINEAFKKMAYSLNKKCEKFGFYKELERLSKLTTKLSIKEWKKVIKSTLGIDIMEDYYLGDFYKEGIQQWIDENVGLIKTIPQESLGRMKEIIEDSFKNGKPTTDLIKQIQKEYSTTKRHATLLARDQISKLNSNIQKKQQTDAGVTEYIWSSVKDSRVRKSHKKLEGKTFKWSDPPETDGGRKCHPGEDYQCRCIAKPVFNRNVNLPIANEVK